MLTDFKVCYFCSCMHRPCTAFLKEKEWFAHACSNPCSCRCHSVLKEKRNHKRNSGSNQCVHHMYATTHKGTIIPIVLALLQHLHTDPQDKNPDSYARYRHWEGLIYHLRLWLNLPMLFDSGYPLVNPLAQGAIPSTGDHHLYCA